MKKIFLLSFVIGFLWSCSPEDNDTPQFYYETLPVESVIMPEQFQYGETHEVLLTYIRPTGCHLFNDLYFVSEGSQRTIAIINTVFTDQDCETFDNEVEEISFNFQVNSQDPYVFRFWQGEDGNGNDIYYVIEVPVVD